MCCQKSSAWNGVGGATRILLTVQRDFSLLKPLGTGMNTMMETITAVFGIMSAGIFLAHALDGYWSRP
jgi:hypothetical protein